MEHGSFVGKLLIALVLSRYRYILKIQIIPYVWSVISERERNMGNRTD